MAAVKSRRNSKFPGETAEYRRARNRLLKSRGRAPTADRVRVAAQQKEAPARGKAKSAR